MGDIGARLLESITRGLYDGNLNCIREYVQNSIDSKAKKIDIYFENGNENLIIKDDAKGMTKQGLKEALRLGWSSKTEEDIGWRGIGIWSGVSVCKRMVIVTKAKNSQKYLIEIDCDKLREEIDKNKDVFEVLTAVTGEIESDKLGKDESLANSQYTMIRLEKILPQLRTVFEKEEIKKYLENTIPAPFNDEFTLGENIETFLIENGIKLPQTEIFFQNEKIFRPPRKTVSTFDVFTPKKFVVNRELIAIAWFITSKNNKKLSDEIGGVVFKKKRFTIGDSNLVIKQCKTSYNKWQIGEIHMVSKDIRENSPRNNFESADNLEDFLNDVGSFIGKLGNQNRYQSKKVVTSYVDKAKILFETGKIDEAEAEINKAKIRFQDKRNFPDEPALIPMKSQIDKQSESDKKNIEALVKQINAAKKEGMEEKDELTVAKEQYKAFCKGLPQDIRDYERKFSSHGKLDFDISITRPIIDLLQQKTGLTSNEIIELSKDAYGWSSINFSGNNPILTVDVQINDKSIKSKEKKRIQHRNAVFGVMTYAVHDLLINLKKHKQGQPSFKWFENASEVEKYKMLFEIYGTLAFTRRLIDQSEKYQP